MRGALEMTTKLTTGRKRALPYLMVGPCVVLLILIGLETLWDVRLIRSR